MFQSTPPWGGERAKRGPFPLWVFSFNPRPRGGRTGWEAADSIGCMVSIHAPVGGRTYSTPKGRDFFWFQSTPPWGGERRWARNSPQSQPVSIHAPVGGRTTCPRSAAWWPRRFNPRPRGGANDRNRRVDRNGGIVSIHAPVGGRTSRRTPIRMIRRVSIHAPVGGRTTHDVQLGKLRASFNPRPRGGANGLARGGASGVGLFQSTPPWGGERGSARTRKAKRRVSIHAPVGGRTHDAGRYPTVFLFQSTPPWGGELSILGVRAEDNVFQSTPPWGGERG